MAGKREKSSSPLNRPITYDTARRSWLEAVKIGSLEGQILEAGPGNGLEAASNLQVSRVKASASEEKRKQEKRT